MGERFPSLSLLTLLVVTFVVSLSFFNVAMATSVDTTAQHQHQHTSGYACPMHPQQTGEEGERCPICNMYLEPIEQETQAQTKYVCPMHPQIVSDSEGTCPICGMNLEKVEVGGASQTIEIEVAGGMQQALGMRTQTVEKGTLWRYVKTLGTVQYDQDSIFHLHARATGWIEKMAINNVGQSVKKGDFMFELYSPELVSAQDDFLQALDYSSSSDRMSAELLRKARLRLELLGISEKTIKQIEASKQSLYRVPFYAPQDGYVSDLSVRDGMYIQPGDTLFELVNLSHVWVIADVFENEQSWLEQGRPADVTAAAQGLFGLEGSIDYIYPELDPVTRAMQVRIRLANPDKKLRPGTLVDVELYGGPKRDLLIIPMEALIQTGRENRVVVQLSDTTFSSVTVKLGIMVKGQAEVLDGLQAGDNVVVSGQFLIDSEASIQGSLQRLSQPSPDGSHHDHSHH
ncbi:efflux RND transporter periplasmic adaptor subunit [Paraferrimonas haliotis]|uniref:Copper/silver efflux pump MFP component CusB n=1 Tax=Paraferrimonas haliotis TaxID=2013866 RepID=A0AA37TYC1_9GAMM|nr:efflux RND transporter periplasmic adaptor subunit [Paraferrimonas haliotis]GLS83531.1 copper/silver efflux pump MFP component CusB [Paraferrimonas haliotis]